MQQITDQITDNLMGLIKEELPAYSPKELLRVGVPSFIVERVRLITEDLLQKEISKPDIIWASMNNELVSHAWEDYLECVYSSSQVPKDHLYDTLNMVVEEVIEVLLEPREKMAHYLFRNNETLNFEEMSKRCDRLTIYKHIGMAIPMYMKKRGLEEISLERCKKLIYNLDEKLVANYTATDWAEKLEMLFIMFGGKVEPEMFVIFFKDKGLNRAARLFSTVKEPLNRRGFIAFLTNEAAGDLVGDETDKEYLINPAPEKEAPPKKTKKEKEEELVDDFFGEYEQEEPQPLLKQFSADDDISEKEMQAILQDIEGNEENFDSDSLNALFVSEQDDEEGKTEDSVEPTDEETKEFRTNLTSILDQAKSSFESIGREEEEEEPQAEATEAEEVVEMDELVEQAEDPEPDEPMTFTAEEEEDEEESPDEEAPMWKKYLTEDQMAVIMGSRNREEEAQEEHTEESEAPVEEPAADVSMEQSTTLAAYMEFRTADFTEALFDGSKKKFDKTISKLDEFKSWAKASEYLQKEVFGKNKTDMFSEEAVAFTDQLQNYFNEHK